MGRIANTMALAFGLFGAVVASQGPEFVQQYRQRLGGAIDELRRVVQQIEADAGQAGQTRDGALDRMKSASDDFSRRRADAMKADVERLDGLQAQRQALDGTGSLGRVLVFVRDFDSQLARAAYDDFVPAVPATEAGLVSAGAGFVGGWALLAIIAGLFRTLLGRSSARRHRGWDGRTA